MNTPFLRRICSLICQLLPGKFLWDGSLYFAWFNKTMFICIVMNIGWPYYFLSWGAITVNTGTSSTLELLDHSRSSLTLFTSELSSAYAPIDRRPQWYHGSIGRIGPQAKLIRTINNQWNVIAKVLSLLNEFNLMLGYFHKILPWVMNKRAVKEIQFQRVRLFL